MPWLLDKPFVIQIDHQPDFSLPEQDGGEVVLGTIGSELAAAKRREQLSLDDRRMCFLRDAESLDAIPGEHNSGAAIETKASVIVQPRNGCRARRGVV